MPSRNATPVIFSGVAIPQNAQDFVKRILYEKKEAGRRNRRFWAGSFLRNWLSAFKCRLLAIRYVAMSLLLICSVPIFVQGAELILEAGATFYLTNYTTVDITGDVTINANGEIDAGNGKIILTGNWTNSGRFIQGTSTVTFSDSAVISTISGGTTFFVLVCTTAGKQLKFTAGSTQVIENTLKLTGTSTDKIKLRSTSDASKWFLRLNKYQEVDYVDIKDCDVLTMNLLCKNSTNSDKNNANIIFDCVQAMVTYSSGTVIYQYRTLSKNTTFWSDLSPLPSGIGTTHTQMVLRECPKRDEFILATLDTAGDIFVATWTVAGNWGAYPSALETAIAASYDDFRVFDVAYESNSGDAMIVYQEDVAGQFIRRDYTSTGWSAEVATYTMVNTGKLGWIKLERNPDASSNEILCVFVSSGNYVESKVWNGTDWTNSIVLSTCSANMPAAPGTARYECFAAAYMNQTANTVMVIYGNRTSASNGIVNSRIWNGTSWGSEVQAMNVEAAEYVEFITLKANTTDQLLATVLDSGDDVNTVTYNSSIWQVPKQQDAGARAADSHYADVCWESISGHENHGVLVFGDASDTDSFRWDGSTWTTTDLFDIWNEVNVCQVERVPDGTVWLAGLENDPNLFLTRIWDSTNHVWGSSTIITGMSYPGTGATTFCLTSSATVIVAAVNSAPNMPTNLTQLVGTNNDIGLAWNAWTDDTTPRLKFDLTDPNAGDKVQYHIQISTQEGQWAAPYLVVDTTQPATATLPHGTTWYETSFSLTVDTSYYWKVKCIDNGGLESVYSSGTISAGQKHWGGYVLPGPITNLSALGDTKSTADGDFQKTLLSWTAPGDDGYIGTCSSYTVRYATWSAGNTSALWDAWWTHASVLDAGLKAPLPTPTAAGTSQTYTITGLTDGTTYYWAIKSVDDASNMAQIDTMTQSGNQPWARVPGTYHPIKCDGSTVDWSTTTERMDLRNNNTFYFTWSSTAVYICYGGNNGDTTTMDFFVFFDTHSDYNTTKGTTVPPANWDNIDTHRLPFAADYALCIEGSAYKAVRNWTGSTWNDPGDGGGIASVTIGNPSEVAILWSYLNNPSSLRVMAFHKWETARNIFNSFPDDNPAPDTDTPVTFTFYYNFTSTKCCQFPKEFATVEAPYAPDPPAGLTQLSNTGAILPSMKWTNSSTIISSFTQIDPNAGTNNVKFYLHVTSVTTSGDAADWAQLWLNYTSAALPEGTTGYKWPALSSNGTYWWRVWSEDAGGLTSSTSTTLGQGGTARLGFDNTLPAAINDLTATNDAGGYIKVNLSWGAVTDSLSGLASYYIYCSSVSAITTANRGDGNHYYLTYKAVGTTSHTDDRSELAANTTYWYAVCGIDRAGNLADVGNSPARRTCRIEIDGDISDWLGTAPDRNNTAVVSSGTWWSEWRWKDKLGDERLDGPADQAVDIERMHITADDTYIYFMFEQDTFTDAEKSELHFAISVDTDTRADDDVMTWNADDSGNTMGAEYDTTLKDNAAEHYPEYNIIVHEAAAGNYQIEYTTGPLTTNCKWYAPPTSGGGANNFNATNDTVEIKIARADIGLLGACTGRFTITSCDNVVLWANGNDTTGNYPTCDALDSVSIPRISSDTTTHSSRNDTADNQNAFDQDISDGDIDFWFDIRLAANGDIWNTPPPIPTSPELNGGTTNAIRPRYNWAQTADANAGSGDAVTSWLIEHATHTDLGSDLSQSGEHGYRINLDTCVFTPPGDLKHNTTFYYRVWSRDRCGALSTTPTNWSVEVDTVPPRAVTTLSALTGDNDGEVKLSWLSPSDDDTATGSVLPGGSSFYIQYTNVLADAENPAFWNKNNAQIKITTGGVSFPDLQKRVVAALTAGNTYYFRLWTWDCANWSDISNAATAQAKITPIADALLVYYSSSTVQADQQKPSYRRWINGAWQAEQTAVDVGGTASPPKVVRICPSGVRREAIMATVEYTGSAYALYISTYTPASGWGTSGAAESDTGIYSKRAFDVAYEQTSGEGLIVYRDDGYVDGNDVVIYRTWTGGNTLSAASTVISDKGSPIQWMRLEPKPSSNEIILTYSDANGNIYSAVWDGSAWGNSQNIMTGYTSAAAAQSFDIAYAQSAGVGFVVWVDTNSTRPKYRTWDGYSWSAETTTAFNHSALVDPRWIKAASNPKNNEIMIGTFDNDTDINAEVYSSTLCAWINGKEHDATASTITGDRAVDVAFEKSSGDGLVVWAEPNTVAARATPSAQKYENGAWSAAGTPTANPITAGIDIVQLAPDDDSDEIFLITLDSANYVYAHRWDGAAWGTPTEIENNSLDDYENFCMNYKKPAAPSDSIAPAAVTSLSGLTVTTSSGTIRLTWSAPGDDVWLGRLLTGSAYNITYCTSTANRVWYDWETATSTSAISPGAFLTYTKSNLVGDLTYYCLIRYKDEKDANNNWAALSNEATAYAQPQILSVSISTPVGGYNFGEVSLGASTQSVAGASGSSITVTNDGNLPENFAIKCETNTVGSSWYPGATQGADRFVLKAGFHTSAQPAISSFADDDIVSSGTYKTCTTSIFSIDGSKAGVNVPVNDTINLWLRLDMPTTSGTAASQEIILFIRAESP